MPDDDPLYGLKGDERILREAKNRFKLCSERESMAQANFRRDMKFCYGDAYNNWQWPEGMASARGGRPTLTCNKTRQHCLQIVNDARQNKGQIEIRPTGGGATYEAAKIFEGVARHIEYISNAQAAYDCASWNQVVGGIGWFRIETGYAPGDSFDQEIYIRRVADALSVYIDIDIAEYDGSDARYGFVFKDWPRDQFRAQYPQWSRDAFLGAGAVDSDGSAIFSDGDGWDDEDHVRVCEYYRKRSVPSKRLKRGEDDKVTSSVVGDDPDADADPDTRTIERTEMDWYLIAGGKIVERKKWPGNYIPLIRVVGEEYVVDGTLDRRGHVRALIDSQRIYNYWSSAAVEYVALQTKTPFVGPADAFIGNENQWRKANIENQAYLAYNAYDEQGREIAAPHRADPPQMPQAYIEGLKIAAEEMRMASGQYQADMGAPSNERSGKAIQERQRQGDNATYHYIEHLGQAIRYAGKIIVDLAPHIYDSDRVIKIMQEDGTQSSVQVKPDMPEAVAPAMDPATGQPMPQPGEKDHDPRSTAQMWNPSVGSFEVESDLGPAYATRRQEAFNAMSQILQTNESLTPVIGDLLFKSADFPMADEIAERLKRMVPPQALGDGPDPQMQQMQQQMQQMHQAMGQMHGQLQQAQAEVMTAKAATATAQAKAAQQAAQHAQAMGAQGGDNDVDLYNAETKRLAAVGAIDPAALMPILREMVSSIIGHPVNPIIAAHARENQAMLPVEAEQQMQ